MIHNLSSPFVFYLYKHYEVCLPYLVMTRFDLNIVLKLFCQR
nr:MAG TPA: hypothetical protein [Caudoviricetes sp.]